MRAYRVTGMVYGGSGPAVRCIKRQFGDDTTVEADAPKGGVCLDASVDPQMVSFAIEGPGYAVESVSG